MKLFATNADYNELKNQDAGVQNTNKVHQDTEFAKKTCLTHSRI